MAVPLSLIEAFIGSLIIKKLSWIFSIRFRFFLFSPIISHSFPGLLEHFPVHRESSAIRLLMVYLPFVAP
jgi:hypothetical protein